MNLIETIKFENGKFANVELHQERMSNSCRELFGFENKIDLVSELNVFQAWTLETGAEFETGPESETGARHKTDTKHKTPSLQASTLKTASSETDTKHKTSPFQASTLETKKCRIIYNKTIQNIELLNYNLPIIKSLKIVFDNTINYNFKFENRQEINQLLAQREDCDDILIVKNGLITDTSYCNILFYNGKKWLTPEKPLLKGTQRQFLINSEMVETANISVADLHNFTKARLINAMIGFEDAMDIVIENIQ